MLLVFELSTLDDKTSVFFYTYNHFFFVLMFIHHQNAIIFRINFSKLPCR